MVGSRPCKKTWLSWQVASIARKASLRPQWGDYWLVSYAQLQGVLLLREVSVCVTKVLSWSKVALNSYTGL